MADLQAGIGPFLGVFLLAHEWNSGMIGTVMSIGGIAGVVMTAPAGALIDATKAKRFWLIVSGVSTMLASGFVLMSQQFWVVAFSQVAAAIAGAAIGPAITGITLGVAKQAGFTRQLGLNQSFNHAGNAAGAALSGYLGWRYGIVAVFLLSALFGVFTVISTLLIPQKTIDHRAARGLERRSMGESAAGLSVIFRSRPLLFLATSLAVFHLGNGVMLSLYGWAVTAKTQSGNGAQFVALTIIVAQCTMILTSLIAVRWIEQRGFWWVLLISFAILPVRGMLAWQWISPSGIYPVQILDGLSAGLQSVAIPGLVAKLLSGTGRINVGQGSVITIQSLGASLSPALGGWLAQLIGYNATFAVLGGFALVSIMIWCGGRKYFDMHKSEERTYSYAQMASV